MERKYFLWVWGNDTSVTEYLRVHGCYLDGVSSGAVTSTHVTVTLSHSPWHTQISVLPVHVMSAWSWVIPQPDTKVLDLDRRLLWNLKTTIHITVLISCSYSNNMKYYNLYYYLFGYTYLITINQNVWIIITKDV